jgi:hypothetical protein
MPILGCMWIIFYHHMCKLNSPWRLLICLFKYSVSETIKQIYIKICKGGPLKTYKKMTIQRVLKLVTQKSPELGATIRSGAFQNICLVLKFLFKPPDGILLVQSCLEILPFFMGSYTVAERSRCWWNDSLATTIAWFNTSVLFCVDIRWRQRQCFWSTCS